MKYYLLPSVIIASAFPFYAHAAITTVPFNSQVDATCTITLQSPGVLGQDGVSKLDSKAAGGRSGRAVVLTTGEGFNLSTTTPTAFSSSPAGVGAVTFDSSYRASGATFIADTPGSTISRLGHGATNVDVDLSATANGFVFPLGRYTAEVTVTCE
ncbi:hypothetical protein [Nitratireductor sp. ZSWI3]|uniref:hypothetical protein n=1 Tax=Nitratireductor sp. ZSWI3 TaxID=2966359 RepID=UPI00214FE88B|nr:hypothetical protein [Nitratireductor sp. ZSWI3]MCR4267810.1 hypothetical protein [Nitratireductor sp. ZSWI3]